LKTYIDFLVVIDTNLPLIMHRFRARSFDRSKIVIFGYPSCVLAADEGVPRDDI